MTRLEYAREAIRKVASDMDTPRAEVIEALEDLQDEINAALAPLYADEQSDAEDDKHWNPQR